jgi:hypothetical protein
MAHFAEIDENNIVQRVVVINNDILLDSDGNEQEALGVEFCAQTFGGTWKQTSYNSNIRKNFAGVGYSYDATRNAFLAPRPFVSWTLDEETCHWQAPVAHPLDDNEYEWDETNQAWSLIE